MAAIVASIAVLVVGGSTAVLFLSHRLRDEIAALLESFDHAQRSIVPVVATVRTDRDRLNERLAQLTDPGSETPGIHR
jgi:hypothetical protein